MNSVNLFVVSGNLGRDPEVKQVASGRSLARFSVAVSESYKGQNGDWVQKVVWMECEGWGKVAEEAGRMSKGDTVLVHGRFGESRWTDKSGQEKVKVVYMVDSLQVMRQRVVREVVEVKPVELVKVEVDDTSWMKEEEVAVVAGPVEEKAKSDGAVDDDIPF